MPALVTTKCCPWLAASSFPTQPKWIIFREEMMDSLILRHLIRLFPSTIFAAIAFLFSVDPLTTHAVSPILKSIIWTNNLLTLHTPLVPSGAIHIWYLEAFLHPGARTQSWNLSKIPHQTQLLVASSDQRHLSFVTEVQTNVQMRHSVHLGKDEVVFDYEIENKSEVATDLQWFQPACIRVGEFMDRQQSNFVERAFIYTEEGFTWLSEARRTTNALYLGGQVYIPPGINHDDANPRPVARLQPLNGLIGCFSADGKTILATASSTTHELFEGVYVCLHSDPHIGGLAPGEIKKFKAKIYLGTDDPDQLLKRYQKDFPTRRKGR